MTPKEFLHEMKKVHEKDKHDPRESHINADDLLCKALTELGYEEGVDYYNNMGKWFD